MPHICLEIVKVCVYIYGFFRKALEGMDSESHAQVMEPWTAAPAFMLDPGYFKVASEILVNCLSQHPPVIQFRPGVEIIQAGCTVPDGEPA